MSLTDKQRAFIEAYLGHFNATQAARDAGYQVSNDATFRTIGSENLAKPNIRKEIDKALSERAMLATEVLHHLAVIARGPTEGQHRLKALELLGKAHGIFKEKHEHTGPNGGPIKHDVTLDDDERLSRLTALLKRAGQTGDRPPADESGEAGSDAE